MPERFVPSEIDQGVVWISKRNGHRTAYHLDADCTRLQYASGTREVAVSNRVLDDLDVCQRCSTNDGRGGGSDGTPLAATLRAANPDDLGAPEA